MEFSKNDKIITLVYHSDTMIWKIKKALIPEIKNFKKLIKKKSRFDEKLLTRHSPLIVDPWDKILMANRFQGVISSTNIQYISLFH
uniref:TilS_C domain-containing protein n=1 Tax=Strongyloides papillosus TaxID=174720 RepID=A0A0N5C3V6_STREA